MGVVKAAKKHIVLKAIKHKVIGEKTTTPKAKGNLKLKLKLKGHKVIGKKTTTPKKPVGHCAKMSRNGRCGKAFGSTICKNSYCSRWNWCGLSALHKSTQQKPFSMGKFANCGPNVKVPKHPTVKKAIKTIKAKKVEYLRIIKIIKVIRLKLLKAQKALAKATPKTKVVILKQIAAFKKQLAVRNKTILKYKTIMLKLKAKPGVKKAIKVVK